MAGKRRPQGPGRRALKEQLDKVLRAASALDKVHPEAGEGLCGRVAAGMAAEIARSIGKSETEIGSELRTGPY